MDTISIHRNATDSNPDIRVLCEAIHRSLSTRDAVIIASLDPATSPEDFTVIVEHPRSEEARTTAIRHMMTLLRHPGHIDMARATRIAQAIAHTARKNKDPQLHATAAYIAWMCGDDQTALEQAAAALDLDPDTGLARIVVTAVLTHLREQQQRL